VHCNRGRRKTGGPCRWAESPARPLHAAAPRCRPAAASLPPPPPPLQPGPTSPWTRSPRPPAWRALAARISRCAALHAAAWLGACTPRRRQGWSPSATPLPWTPPGAPGEEGSAGQTYERDPFIKRNLCHTHGIDALRPAPTCSYQLGTADVRVAGARAPLPAAAAGGAEGLQDPRQPLHQAMPAEGGAGSSDLLSRVDALEAELLKVRGQSSLFVCCETPGVGAGWPGCCPPFRPAHPACLALSWCRCRA